MREADIDVGNRPLGVVLSRDGRTAYVANQGDGTVSVIDVAKREVVASVSVPGGTGGLSLAASPDGRTLYASGFRVDGGVSTIDTTTNLVAPGGFGGRPIAGGPIAVSPDGTRGYVDDDGMGGFRILDLERRIAKDEWLIRDSGAPSAVAIAPGGRFLYSVNPGCTAAIIDTGKAPITPTSPDIGLPSASAQVAEVVIGCNPADVKALPTRNLVAVVDADGSLLDESTLSWIDTSTRRLVGREVSLGLPRERMATGIAIASDEGEAFVLHRNRADGSDGVLSVMAFSPLAPSAT